MSLSKGLPCDFEQCHPLLWGGGILVDHWSTISSLIQISQKFILMCPIVNMSPLVQVMACQQIGDKPLPEPMRPNLWHHWIIGAHKSWRTCLLNQWTNIIPLLPRIRNQFFHLPLAWSRRKLTLVVHNRSRGFQVVTTRGIHNLEFSYWCLAYHFISMNIFMYVAIFQWCIVYP